MFREIKTHEKITDTIKEESKEFLKIKPERMSKQEAFDFIDSLFMTPSNES